MVMMSFSMVTKSPDNNAGYYYYLFVYAEMLHDEILRVDLPTGALQSGTSHSSQLTSGFVV